MRPNTEGAAARAAVSGISSKNPLQPRRGMLKVGKAKKETSAKPQKVASERVTTPPKTKPTSERVTTEEENLPPIRVWSQRVYPPQEAIGEGKKSLPAPPAKKASKPRKPRDVKYTQPPLPGMRNKAKFREKNGKD